MTQESPNMLLQDPTVHNPVFHELRFLHSMSIPSSTAMWVVWSCVMHFWDGLAHHAVAATSGRRWQGSWPPGVGLWRQPGAPGTTWSPALAASSRWSRCHSCTEQQVLYLRRGKAVSVTVQSKVHPLLWNSQLPPSAFWHLSHPRGNSWSRRILWMKS